MVERVEHFVLDSMVSLFSSAQAGEFTCTGHVPYMDSALNMDIPNAFKRNKFYRHMALHVREEKQLKYLYTFKTSFLTKKSIFQF